MPSGRYTLVWMIPGRPCRLWGLAGPLEVGGRVRVRLAMKTLPVGGLEAAEVRLIRVNVRYAPLKRLPRPMAGFGAKGCTANGIFIRSR
jgi:hypothetical protein